MPSPYRPRAPVRRRRTLPARPRAKAKRKVMTNFRTAIKGKTGRGVIRPQNQVPMQSVISLRYKQSVDLGNIPINNDGAPNGSGVGFVINMSDPTSTALIQTQFVNGTPAAAYNIKFSNTSVGGGQDNLTQALTDSGLYDKYDHFYVRKSVCTFNIRGKPNQYKLAPFLETLEDANNDNAKYLNVRAPELQGSLYNFAVMSDRASVNLVDESVLKVRHHTAGVKLRMSNQTTTSQGRDCSFKLTYTPKRLGIKDPGDNRALIGFTSQSNVQENSFAQFVVGKQLFPLHLGSALSVCDIAIDYEIVAMERRITDNDAMPRPLNPHAGDL
ncbi:MAG: putative capsid protein [Circoviridae sp.]|nr:MAG: putative capsid protein [Circoviridae sp.]